MGDDDFAETINNTIVFNEKALRNRAITEGNMVHGNRFSSRNIEDIAFHEFGHILSQKTGNIGVEIAQKA